MLLTANIHKMLVNGDQWGRWQGYQLPLSDQYVSIWTPKGTTMYWKPGAWVSQQHQLTYFWPGEWFTIHVGYSEDGKFVSGYCDVILPTPAYTSTMHELIYTDLYVDVVVREDFSVFTKDHEVFERAANCYPIVAEARKKSFEVLDRLEQQAIAWSGPFQSIPRHLPRTDFLSINQEQARSSILSALNNRKP